MKKYSVLIALVLSLLLVFSIAHAERTVWYVHPDSSLNSIQAGLDSCADNDIVLVGPGTYVENIIWPNTQGIHLISELGPEATIIDGGNPSNPDTGSVVLFISGEDSNSVLAGFTITNGTGTFDPAYSSYDGGGIYCRYNSSPTIIGNIITGNTATYGAGIECWTYASPTITGNTITGNKANSTGGGIACYGYSSPIITDNAITQNEAGVYGGAIVARDIYTPLIITGNTMTGNVADSGCIAIWDVAAEISRNTISMNFTKAGIGCRGAGTIHIDSCTISKNEQYGVWCDSAANPEIHYCNIYDHTDYGVINLDSTVIVDAEDNWWGDATGPGGYGPGSGDSVSQWVDYDPWLTDSVEWLGIEEHKSPQPISTVLQISPNPFHSRVTINFSIDHSVEHIELKIYDATGRLVKEFGHTANQRFNQVIWAGDDNYGNKVPSGVYFLKFTTERVTETRKLLLIR